MQTRSNISCFFSKKLCLILTGFFTVFICEAQVDIPKEERELKALFDTLFINDGVKFYQPDSIKLQLSEEIFDRMNELLTEPASFSYSFDALNRLGVRKSRDKKVKIYTWSIKLEKGQHRYYGFIQKKERRKIQLFPLHEAFYETDSVKYLSLTQDNWLGANYYQIIDFKRNSKRYYLLIGMRNNGYASKSKIMEVLSFSRKKAKFGKKVFVSEEKKLQRILFEYSYQVSMMLQYDKRYDMIVFDHLAPENSTLKGEYRFYGPDGSYDAYQYNGSKWVYKPEVWVVGEKRKIDKRFQQKPFQIKK